MLEGKNMNGIESNIHIAAPETGEVKNSFATSLEARLAMLKESTKTTKELKNTGLKALQALDTTNTLEQAQKVTTEHSWRGLAAFARLKKNPREIETLLNNEISA